MAASRLAAAVSPCSVFSGVSSLFQKQQNGRSTVQAECFCRANSWQNWHLGPGVKQRRPCSLSTTQRAPGTRFFPVRQALPDDTGEASTSGSNDDETPGNAELDWREFRARLVARSAAEAEERRREEQLETDAAAEKAAPQVGPGGSWAHPLTNPEIGSLVIAKPGYFSQNQQYFNHAVIFLLHHGEEGTMGIILNKPTDHTLGTLFDGIEKMSPELAPARLYLGGDVGQGATHVLHSQADLEGAKKIVEGVYAGGFEAIVDHIRAGKSKCEDYRWFHMYAGWGPGQLENEVKAGVWYLGSCSKDLLLKHNEDLERPLWEEVLRLMGGTYAEVAKQGAKDMP